MKVLIYLTDEKSIPKHEAGQGKTNDNGVFSLTCKVPDEANVGTNHVLAHALGNKTYSESWSDPEIEIYSKSKLDLEPTESIGINSVFNITGSLKDDSDQPITNKDIHIYWNDSYLGQTETNETGIFLYQYTPTKLGGCNLTAIFNGDKYLNSSQDSLYIYVKDISTQITLTLSKSQVLREETITITGKLSCNTDLEMSDKEIEIYYNNILNKKVQTNNQCNFETTITTPEDSTVGNNTIEVYYPGSEIFAEAKKTKNIFIQSETKTIITSPTKSQIEKNQTILISGKLVDNIDQIFQNSSISINWTYYNTTILTNENGEFNYALELPASFPTGFLTIKAEFKGNQYYLSSTDTKKIEIVEQGYSNQKESKNTYIFLIILAGILIAIMVCVIMLRNRQKQQNVSSIQEIARETIHRLQKNDDDKQSVINCYKQMCDWLNKKGIKKGSYQTPREFAIAIRNYLKIKPENLYALTQIFEKARYSNHEISNIEKEAAIESLNEIVNAQIINIDENTQKKDDNE